MTTRHRDHLTQVDHLEDIPAFASEDDEHAFWANHELAPELWECAAPLEPDELPAPRSTTRPVATRFDEHTLTRLKALARCQGKGYQTLLKEFVTERLDEEEKRAGPLS
jgi:hypothetical protein